jgi:hypothetical protein
LQKRIDFLQLMMDAHKSELDVTDENDKVSAMDYTTQSADEYKTWKDIGKKRA